ncbi:MAG: hypothetical protein JW751_07630 [Polyangiaceae bacterium]|nr:hypothetical protein [Polyangiaceae bacterium]
MMRAPALVVLFMVGACGAGTPAAPAAPGPPLAPGISIPVPIAEGRPQPDQSLPPLPLASAALAQPARSPDLPDPEPLRLERQWEYEITYDRGRVSVTKVRPLLFDKPVVTPRRVGRYAIELWIGRELVDRIRFDFPVLAAEEPPASRVRQPLHEPPSLALGATVRRVVLVPASPRATRAVIVDRATGETIPLPWPPERPLPPIDSAPRAPGSATSPPAASGSAWPAASAAAPSGSSSPGSPAPLDPLAVPGK